MLNKIRKHYIITAIIILLLAGAIVARLYLSVWLTGYVNNVLHHDVKGYRGSIDDLSIDLYRGAYHITNLKVYKIEGHIPTPFIHIEDVDFSLQWSALLHGRIVSKVYLDRPVLNFATNETGQVTQTGNEIDWTKPIKALMPIDINQVTMKEGEITYKDFSSSPPVDVYIHHLQGKITNFRNVTDEHDPLPSRIELDGDSIGGGLLHIRARANILKKVPDFYMAGKLENVNLPALNNYTDSYAAIDFKEGNLSIYSELEAKNSQLSGYVKPIANHISMINLQQEKNPVKILWESLAAAIVTLFTNHPKDQFATKIEISGNIGDVQVSTWSAIAGIVHNAFIKAFNRGIDGFIPSENPSK